MKFVSRIIQIYENRAKRDTLNHLRSLSDKQLLDCGISPDLLNEGLKAWPWRELPEIEAPLRFARSVNYKRIPAEDKTEVVAGERVIPVRENAA